MPRRRPDQRFRPKNGAVAWCQHSFHTTNRKQNGTNPQIHDSDCHFLSWPFLCQ